MSLNKPSSLASHLCKPDNKQCVVSIIRLLLTQMLLVHYWQTALGYAKSVLFIQRIKLCLNAVNLLK